MTVVSVSKETVIKALQQEPLKNLRSGMWMRKPGFLNSSETVFINDPKCKVCAVGAVMRKVLSNRTNVEDVESIVGNNIHDEACCSSAYHNDTERLRQDCANRVEKSPLAALSRYFETLSFHDLVKYDYSSKAKAKIRKQCIEFVEEFFPERITLDIGDASPGVGIRRVK